MSNLTLEEFENYDVSGMNHGQLSKFIHDFYEQSLNKGPISWNLNKWDVSKCTSMSHMFSGCYALAHLDLSNWNVSNCTDMSHMFNNCHALAHLDLSNWNVSKCTSMKSMFSGCCALAHLDLSNWNVSKCTDMNNMFSWCCALAYLDLSNWSVSECIGRYNMFNACYSLPYANETSDYNISPIIEYSKTIHPHMKQLIAEKIKSCTNRQQKQIDELTEQNKQQQQKIADLEAQISKLSSNTETAQNINRIITMLERQNSFIEGLSSVFD